MSTAERNGATRSSHGLSVGRLATETGIAAETLRIWERRYGRPKPERLPSGHRRYSPDLVPWLRKVAEGLALGMRPSNLLPLSDEALDAALSRKECASLAPEVVRWLALAAASDAPRLAQALEQDAQRLAPLEFMDERLAPFLREVGKRWGAGELGVRHEHQASEVVQRFLHTRLRAVAPPAGRRPRLLLATLSGDEHGLGLAMVAWACAELGVEARLLGVGAPVEEIAACAVEVHADAVGIGVSLAAAGAASDRGLTALRDRLPEGCLLIAGGEGLRGGRRGPRGVRVFAHLAGFADWVRTELEPRFVDERARA